jgi:hypothetical protein
VVWFEALSSHTQWHLLPSSRSAAVAFAVMLSSLLLAMAERPTLGQLWEHLKSAVMLRRSKSGLGAH